MDWDWLATVAVWLVWAIILIVLLVGLNYALRGLTWCSLRSIWRLDRVCYVARRIALSERILCDGKGLCYSPRARSSPPKLHFAPNVAGWEPGVLTPEVCANMARDEISGRSIVLGMVVAALGFAWIIMLLLNPGASGGPIFGALFLLSALLVVHTIYPFTLSIFPRLRLSPGRAKGDAKDPPPQDASSKGAEEGASRPEFPDDFVGSKETLDDLDRFCSLQRHVLGARHESVFVGRYYRSLTLFHLDRHEAGLADIATYVNAQRRALGERNLLTLKVRYLKAGNLALLGKWPAALEELGAVAPLQTAVLGAAHPHTLMTRSARVEALATLERYAEASEELNTLLPDCERVFGPDDRITSANLRLKGIALQRLDSAPKHPESSAMTAVSPEPPETPKPTARPKARPAASAPPSRRPADVLIAPAQRQPMARTLAPVAGAAFLGILAIGAGIFTANSAQRESEKSSQPSMMVQPSLPPPNPAPISLSAQTVPETLAVALEDEREGGAPATEEPVGLSVEDYAASMIAGRNGAKVREAPDRDAPLVVRVAAGSALRVTGRAEDSDHQWFRVVLPDRRSGFVRDDVVARDADAIEDYAPASPMAAGRAGANVRSAPRTGAPVIVRLEAGSDLRITGRRQALDHTWFRVAVDDGRVGFVRDDVVEAVRSR